MNQEQKAEKVRLQTIFGELMWQTFANLIALHRWRRVEAVRRLRDSEEQNKRAKFMVGSVDQVPLT